MHLMEFVPDSSYQITKTTDLSYVTNIYEIKYRFTRAIGACSVICAVSRATAIQGGRRRVLACPGAGLRPGPAG